MDEEHDDAILPELWREDGGMIKPTIRYPYKTWNFGRWELGLDNDEEMLVCPDCKCRMIWRWYELAVGQKGLNFCPYCGARMGE